MIKVLIQQKDLKRCIYSFMTAIYFWIVHKTIPLIHLLHYPSQCSPYGHHNLDIWKLKVLYSLLLVCYTKSNSRLLILIRIQTNVHVSKHHTETGKSGRNEWMEDKILGSNSTMTAMKEEPVCRIGFCILPCLATFHKLETLELLTFLTLWGKAKDSIFFCGRNMRLIVRRPGLKTLAMPKWPCDFV